MQIVLLEHIKKLGQIGDIVTVKDGYARNYLLPQQKAIRANQENITRFEGERVQLEARSLELKKEAEQVKEKLDNESIIIIRQASDTGQLYGSVSPKDIAKSLTEQGFSMHRNQIKLNTPIKILGLHNIDVKLHPEVFSSVIVNVARTENEAALQITGQDVTQEQPNEENDILDNENMFENNVDASLVQENTPTEELEVSKDLDNELNS